MGQVATAIICAGAREHVKDAGKEVLSGFDEMWQVFVEVRQVALQTDHSKLE